MIVLALAIAVQGPVTTEQDHRETLQMLGIQSLRMYADGMNPNAPNAANTDESKAAIWGPFPELMRFQDGSRVRTRADWARRRKELVELFDREVYGRTPKRLPRVRWEVREDVKAEEFGVRVRRKSLVGVVDNRSFPSVKVEIPVTLVVPGEARRAPTILSFGFAPRPGRPAPPPAPGASKPWTQQILERGWAYAILVPTAVQADNGAGLRQGIIGLANQGKLRKADDWGALKAWGWAASRALDRLAKEPGVDGRKVAIEGLSRYGKAALVTMAYDERFAAALVGSSGAGGAKLWRRDFGERETNIASSGEYHWVAPSFIRYAGPLTPRDLPVDQHQFLALCAPRPVFVGVGSPKVEGHWVDGVGMFQAAVLASPAWRLLGAKGLPTDQMPPEDQGLTDTTVAFRKHSGGHTNGPNWSNFLDWFGRFVVGR